MKELYVTKSHSVPSQYLHALTANTLVTDVGARDNSQYNHRCDGLDIHMIHVGVFDQAFSEYVLSLCLMS